MSLNNEQILEVLKTIKYPGFSRDIVAFGLIQSIDINGDEVAVKLTIQTRDANIPKQLYGEIREALENMAEIRVAQVDIEIKEPPQAMGKKPLKGVKKVIAIASGKGGVGKSTTSANLAVALAAQGLKVGLCDCDLYGPSIAHMMGNEETPYVDNDDRMIPQKAHGVAFMSMGLLLQEGSPVIVRGPLATRYTQQFLEDVAWDFEGELDILILDLPPGTGDIQLTIVQTVDLTGAIIVTTPQEVALIDARKAVSMFEKVNVPLLGLIENMAWFECEHGKKYYLFGKDGGQREAKRLGIPLLAQVPLEEQTREQADQGLPAAALKPKHSPTSSIFTKLAKTFI